MTGRLTMAESPAFRALARMLAMLAPAPLWAQAPSGGQGPPAFKLDWTQKLGDAFLGQPKESSFS
jgi:hypothetical protein